MKIKQALTFDDVLLAPKYSDILTRSGVDIGANLGKYHFKFPIIPANMMNIVGPDMIRAITKADGLSILHRFMPFEEQIDIFKYFDTPEQLGLSIGVKEMDFKNAEKMIEEGVNIICVDIAHGDSYMCCEMIEHLRTLSKDNDKEDLVIIAGNVATGEGAMRLWEAGATAVKVGIGSGRICSTRIETGNGVPQLSALDDVYSKRRKYRKLNPADPRPMQIISDGGIRSPGDCVKALCFADMIMAGGIFAGTDETPGGIVIEDNVSYKRYEGSSTHRDSHIEGVKGMIPSKGSVENVVMQFTDGIRSGCSYQGVTNLVDLKKSPRFVQMSSAGLHESHPHNIKL